ncbi:MAG: hypothetical protein ABL929_01045 [Ferruginibacter sp.]|nr:hypothetical protein [Ferruginibacter sp.]
MNNLSKVFLTILVFIQITSCTKPKTNEPALITPEPPKPDTLSSGWSKIKVNESLLSSSDVFFTSNTTGYFSTSSNGTFKSVDGGNTWNQIYKANGDKLNAINIAATNDGKTFFCNSSAIFKTIDFGTTITEYPFGGIGVSDVFFGDNNTGLSSTSTAGLFLTTNGGNSWNNISALPEINSNLFSTIFMLGNSNAWVCYGNKIYHSNGNLSSFKLDSVPNVISNIGLISIFATSTSVVYTCSYSGYLFKSVDGGNTFTFLTKLGVTNGFSDIHFIDSNTGYISVGNRVYKTNNAGNTWNVIIALGNTSIIEIHFTDAAHGWACCADGTVLKLN